MAGATPTYGLPYLELDDPPNLASATQDLAEAVETELARIDATVQPAQAENTATFAFNNAAASATATTGTAAATVGLTFVAPPSGKVYVTVSGNLTSDQATNAGVLSYEVRSGGTIGSGTLMLSASFVRAVMTPEVVNGGQQARIGASNRYMVAGLTPGSTYNARTMHWITPAGQGTMYHRHLLVEPVL